MTHLLTRDEWMRMAAEPAPPLVALWADTREVYALLRQEDGAFLVATTVEDGAFPALSPVRPVAAWFERMVRDLWGHTATGGTDQRPWLDHGRWPHSMPMAVRPGPVGGPEQPEFLLAETLDQVPLGPVRGGIEPAAHLRFGVAGEAIVRMETRLGYTHKGTLALMRGKSPRAAARFAARLTGEMTVAHSIAFARATEAALGCELPPRALALREVMAGIERITWHLDVRTAIAEAKEVPMHAFRSARLAETMRRAANVAFGHRLMMDCVIPGGVATDIAAGGSDSIAAALAGLEAELPDLAFQGGEGDDIGQTIAPLQALLRDLPNGALAVSLDAASGEGIGHVSGPAGDIWHWLRLDHGQIASVFMCDPAWARWPLLETTLTGGALEDVPTAVAALGLSSSGMDL